MNVFNRIIMIIAMLAIIVFSIVAIVNTFVGLFEWQTIADRAVNSLTSLNLYLMAGVLFLILVIAIIILILEFYRRKIKHANISTDQTGKTMVTLNTAASQIRGSLGNVYGIIDPRVKVTPMRDGIIIDIFSQLTTGINVVDKTREIRQTAIDFASKNLGFKVIQMNYTATGFVAGKTREIQQIKKEESKETQVKPAEPIVSEIKETESKEAVMKKEKTGETMPMVVDKEVEEEKEIDGENEVES